MATTRKQRGNLNTIPTCTSSLQNNSGRHVRGNKRNACQEPITATTTKKRKTTNNTTKNGDDEEKVVQELPHTPTTTNTDDDATTTPTTTSALASRRNTARGKTATTNNDNNTDTSHTIMDANDDTTAEPTAIPATATALKKNNKTIVPVSPMKKDKHIAETGIHIITPSPDTKNRQGGAHTLPLTPPASASASEESPTKSIEDEVDSLKGYTDEEWFSLMGWRFSENKDHDFVDKHGKASFFSILYW